MTQQITRRVRTRSFLVASTLATFHALDSRSIVTEGDALMESAPGKEGNFLEVNSSSENTKEGIRRNLRAFRYSFEYSWKFTLFLSLYFIVYIYINSQIQKKKRKEVTISASFSLVWS